MHHEAYGSSIGWTYDGEPISRPVTAAGESVPPLDPIDPKLVGGLKVKALHAFCVKNGIRVLAKLLAILISEQEADDYFRPVTWGGRVPVIGAKYHGHLKALVECGLLIPRHANECRWWSGYFAVAKTRQTCRSIFNGRRLSGRSPVPPTVNLTTPVALLKRLRDHAAERGRIEMILGDFRHWFHQVPASEALQRLFGLRDAEGHNYLWRSIPMGWSWSPCLAQACAWASLLYCEEGQKSWFNLEGLKDEGAQLPTFVPLSSGRGFMTVYYDNFVVVSSDSDEADAIGARILSSCQKVGAVIKEGSYSRVRQTDLHRSWTPILGLALKTEGTKGRTQRILCRPAKLDSWAELPAPKETMSCRAAAEYIGRCLFAASPDPRGLRRSPIGREGIAIARRIGAVAWRAGWTGEVQVTGLVRLWELVLAMRDNPIVVPVETKEKTGPVVLVTSDASMKGYGWAVFEDLSQLEAARCSSRVEGTWDDEKEHIFMKELRCALMALRAAQGRRIHLIVDNSAVAWALLHGFSSSIKATEMMDDYETEMENLEKVTLVVSQDNPGDCPSRAIQEAREKAYRDWNVRCMNLCTALKAEQQGWRWSSCKVEEYQKRAEERIRHSAPPDELVMEQEDQEQE